jgi:hypothetical protein
MLSGVGLLVWIGLVGSVVLRFERKVGPKERSLGGRFSPLEPIKDRPWMTLKIEHLSYYHISIHGVDKLNTL